MSNAGIPLRIIQEISGHSNLDQLQRYLEVKPDQVRGAIASLSMLSYTGKQKFHGWLKSLIVELTEGKWAELGGKTITVIAAYTSQLAYDGSGMVKRDPKNYALATFTSGKKYNCDLNGSHNIATRGWQKLDSRKDYEKRRA